MTPELLDTFSGPFWVTLLVAIACGGTIGLERQVRGKPAGLRTAILICPSTALFVHLGRAVASPGMDPTRVLAQVVTGVGFLGAGDQPAAVP
jgi:putative Mg2+ transporter-C (MgtC) family protein